ncbi:MAG: metal ABC transporter substrate-binding protein [Sedimentisphaeraceae bacterium JB056]
MKPYITTCLLIFIPFIFGCRENKTSHNNPAIAVSSSYIEAALKDICGKDANILLIVPPGMCPGHFDISPQKVKMISDCRLLLLFDFQTSMADSLNRLKDNGLNIESLSAPGGLCKPQSYMSVVEQISIILSELYPEKKDFYTERKTCINQRMISLQKQLITTVTDSHLSGTKILSATHQADFAKWLGLDVISTYGSQDTTTAYEINQILQKIDTEQISIIIANKQQGSQLESVLSERLNVRFTEFNNFPLCETGNAPFFDTMVTDNVNKLIEKLND